MKNFLLAVFIGLAFLATCHIPPSLFAEDTTEQGWTPERFGLRMRLLPLDKTYKYADGIPIRVEYHNTSKTITHKIAMSSVPLGPLSQIRVYDAKGSELFLTRETEEGLGRTSGPRSITLVPGESKVVIVINDLIRAVRITKSGKYKLTATHHVKHNGIVAAVRLPAISINVTNVPDSKTDDESRLEHVLKHNGVQKDSIPWTDADVFGLKGKAYVVPGTIKRFQKVLLVVILKNVSDSKTPAIEHWGTGDISMLNPVIESVKRGDFARGFPLIPSFYGLERWYWYDSFKPGECKRFVYDITHMYNSWNSDGLWNLKISRRVFLRKDANYNDDRKLQNVKILHFPVIPVHVRRANQQRKTNRYTARPPPPIKESSHPSTLKNLLGQHLGA